jgi:hypothetical protein
MLICVASCFACGQICRQELVVLTRLSLTLAAYISYFFLGGLASATLPLQRFGMKMPFLFGNHCLTFPAIACDHAATGTFAFLMQPELP